MIVIYCHAMTIHICNGIEAFFPSFFIKYDFNVCNWIFFSFRGQLFREIWCFEENCFLSHYFTGNHSSVSVYNCLYIPHNSNRSKSNKTRNNFYTSFSPLPLSTVWSPSLIWRQRHPVCKHDLLRALRRWSNKNQGPEKKTMPVWTTLTLYSSS